MKAEMSRSHSVEIIVQLPELVRKNLRQTGFFLQLGFPYQQIGAFGHNHVMLKRSTSEITGHHAAINTKPFGLKHWLVIHIGPYKAERSMRVYIRNLLHDGNASMNDGACLIQPCHKVILVLAIAMGFQMKFHRI